MREFIHVVGKEESAIGVLVCFEKFVTKPMQIEAKEHGHFELYGNKYDKIQILTVEDLMNKKVINMPYSIKQTFKKAEKKTIDKSEQTKLFQPKEKQGKLL